MKAIANGLARCAALSLLLAASNGALGAIITTGKVPPSPSIPIGPGDTDLGVFGAFVGPDAAGTLTVDGGSVLHTNGLVVAGGGVGPGTGDVLVSGTNSTIALTGLNQVQVGSWGRGTLKLADGAHFDGRSNAAACLANNACGTWIGLGAGSDADLTLTGSGTRGEFTRFFAVGGALATTQPYGTPGGAGHASVNVLAGASLTTQNLLLGQGPIGNAALGTERSNTSVDISGAGSVWTVTGGAGTGAGELPLFLTSPNAIDTARVSISDGGLLRMQGNSRFVSYLGLADGPGTTDAFVSGEGSRIEFTGDNGAITVGAHRGNALLRVDTGATVAHMQNVIVGADAGVGDLEVDGVGTLLQIDGRATRAVEGSNFAPFLGIGRNGNGFATISNGARVEISTELRLDAGPGLNVGEQPLSYGRLSIDSGAVVHLHAASVTGAGAGEAFNPTTIVGLDTEGVLNISGGAKLISDGNAIGEYTNRRFHSTLIGLSGRPNSGAHGVMAIEGPGSALEMRGTDPFVGIGYGDSARGELYLSNGARLDAMSIGVGELRQASGLLVADNAHIELIGEFTNIVAGGGMCIGCGEGALGSVRLANDTELHIANFGQRRITGITLGGTTMADDASVGDFNGGDGELVIEHSRVRIEAGPQGGTVIGSSGNGLMLLRDGSVYDQRDSDLLIARTTSALGFLRASGASTISAGWVGVGRNHEGGAEGTDGGSALLFLDDSTLYASDMVIGTYGLVGGSSGAIVVTGSIVNYGTFSPGESPGLLTIDGDFTAGAGSRFILEVEDDGAGGFLHDEIHFVLGNDIDLHALSVEFSFLGDTDPLAFLASGLFDIDTFIRVLDGMGNEGSLEASAFDGVSFAARSDRHSFSSFSYRAGGTPSFTLDVPTPAGTLVLGVLSLLALQRRQRANRLLPQT